MGRTIKLRSLKKEEEQVLDNSLVPELPEFDDDFNKKETSVEDEFEGILGIEDEDSFIKNKEFYCQLNWDFMEWEGFGFEEQKCDQKVAQMGVYLQESHCFGDVKRENCGFWDECEQENKKVSLNLSLNYQEVLDAWSNRGSLFADEYAPSMANSGYMGEVPGMEEDRTKREASVMRYKEKRQNRLFSKKIRYHVRKLNADNRPRLKGRFVKRGCEKIFEG